MSSAEEDFRRSGEIAVGITCQQTTNDRLQLRTTIKRELLSVVVVVTTIVRWGGMCVCKMRKR